MSAQAGRVSRAKSLFTRWTRDPLFGPEMRAAASWIAAHLMDCIAACTLPAWIHSRDQRGAPFYRCALRLLFGCAESQVAFSFLPSTKRWKTKCPNCGGRCFLQTRTIGLDSLSMHHILFLRHLNQYISCITQAVWRHTCCIVLTPLADALWVPRAQSHFSEGTFTIWGV